MTRDEMRAKATERYDAARTAYAAGNEATAQAYDVEVGICHLDGDDLMAEFYSALRDCYRNVPGAQERKDKAHAKIEARSAARDAGKAA